MGLKIAGTMLRERRDLADMCWTCVAVDKGFLALLKTKHANKEQRSGKKISKAVNVPFLLAIPASELWQRNGVRKS